METELKFSELSSIIREALLPRFVGKKCPQNKHEIVDVEVSIDQSYYDENGCTESYLDLKIDVVTETPVRKIKNYHEIYIVHDWY